MMIALLLMACGPNNGSTMAGPSTTYTLTLPDGTVVDHGDEDVTLYTPLSGADCATASWLDGDNTNLGWGPSGAGQMDATRNTLFWADSIDDDWLIKGGEVTLIDLTDSLVEVEVVPEQRCHSLPTSYETECLPGDGAYRLRFEVLDDPSGTYTWIDDSRTDGFAGVVTDPTTGEDLCGYGAPPYTSDGEMTTTTP